MARHGTGPLPWRTATSCVIGVERSEGGVMVDSLLFPRVADFLTVRMLRGSRRHRPTPQNASTGTVDSLLGFRLHAG